MTQNSAVLHRDLNRTVPTVIHGEGVWLTDAAGKRYLDASGGAAVSCLGHGHAGVAAAITEQLGKLAYSHTSFFTNEPSEALARRLTAHAPAGFADGAVAFLGSGSEAVEAALKLARQYHVERGEPDRTRFISRRLSYHGNTLGALAVGGHPGRRAVYQPLLAETFQIAPCNAYRDQRDDETEAAYGARVAGELETMIQTLGPATVAAFIAEPVSGASLGSAPAVAGYFAEIRAICDRHGVLFIADEVMCGMGRCGTLFALEAEGVSPDLITIAKGLGAGYQPIGAVMASGKLVQAIREGSGLLANGHTYMSHAVACAASLAVLDALEDGLLANVQRQGALLEKRLRDTFAQHAHIGDIRGRGLFWSLEIVEDRASKTPFPPAQKLAARLKAEAMEHGLICYPSSGTADGVAGDHILLAPPFIISDAEIEELIQRLDATLRAVLGA